MHAEVQRYYGQVLQTSADLKTSACCTVDEPPPHVKAALKEIHEEVASRYYGCGLVLPEALEGTTILDLGCGSGRDCYLLSQLTGPGGRVVGVDMTTEQLEVARRHLAWHAERFGYPSSNVDFIEGDIESLEATGLADETFDVIVSNCVINLTTNKQAVLDQAYRLLKPGGEVYFADIYSDRRIPGELKSDPVLYGECLAGALYWNDFISVAGNAGFSDPRLVTDRPVTVEDPALRDKVADVQFFSATCRLFKLPELEPASEDYGQRVQYLGTAPQQPDRFELDKHHVFDAGEPAAVCGNTYLTLARSRLAPFFEFEDGEGRHAGPFQGRNAGLPFDRGPDSEAPGCC
jgi:arsenite methyltransferase